MLTGINKKSIVQLSLALLRIVIGWHFLFEGLIKILNPDWTAKQFLIGSRWILGDLFRLIASNETGIRIVNIANEYGLALIGLALILGLFTRLASYGGIGLLLMYYIAYPPFGGFSYGSVAEGSYLIVNKNLIELVALTVIAITNSGLFFGLDKLLHKRNMTFIPPVQNSEGETDQAGINTRRELIKGLAGIPFLAIFSGSFLKNMAEKGPDAFTGASSVRVQYKDISDLTGKLPEGRLGDLKISRMIMGCNLIDGVAHARDLKYVDKLFKAYNTDQRVLETLHLGEAAGINATFMVNKAYPLFNKYRKAYGSKMKSICQIELKPKDFYGDINRAIDNGADTMYIVGYVSDKYVKEGNIDMLAKAIDQIKKQGYLAGMGGHSLEVIKAWEREDLPADYYVKTFHNDNYWSAHPLSDRVEFSVDTVTYEDHNKIHDNMFDLFPLRTAEYMKEVKKPWIAFKVLAGGAILPEDGFRHAFENGADFICVGMFDFQIIDNVNTACKILKNLNGREREWFA